MNKLRTIKFLLCSLLLLFISKAFAQNEHRATKPLFNDPIYHGAANPVIVWNKQKGEWWMFYTNRRATIDGAIGGHCDVVVAGDRAYVYYFAHPGRTKQNPPPKNLLEAKRSVIQVAELTYSNGEVQCNRDAQTIVDLSSKK